MIIDKDLLNELTAQAMMSSRLRMNKDLRNSPSDGSQRMLNAIAPGSPLPIHRHTKSSETVICLRGHLSEVFYNNAGEVTKVIDIAPNSDCAGICIPTGQWHSVEVLESGTVIMECNGCIERFHRTLEEASEAIRKFVDNYNWQLLIYRLGYKTPLEYREEYERKVA